MNNSTIKHGLRRNLPDGTMYNSQAAAIIIMVGFAFKLSSAPGIISADFTSSTFWIFLGFSAVEIICALFIFAFSRMGGDGLLMATSSFAYKVLCLIASCWLSAKAVFYFCYCSSYLAHELFTGTQPFLIYVLFLVPVVYLGLKGTRTIARSCELFAPLFLAVIILNLAFLDSDMDFGRNLPIFSKSPTEFFMTMPRYGLWLGDMFPFVFVRIRNKKLPYVTLGIATTWTIVNLIALVGVALYGDALKMVKDLLIHIASFNQLSLEIGRMEWTNLFGILMMSLYSLAFLFDGANEACRRALSTSLPSKIACPIAILCSTLFTPSLQEVTNVALGTLGYAFSGVATILPVLLTLLAARTRKKHAALYRCLDAEFQPPKPNQSAPDSQNDGVLYPFKNSQTAQKGERL